MTETKKSTEITPIESATKETVVQDSRKRIDQMAELKDMLDDIADELEGAFDHVKSKNSLKLSANLYRFAALNESELPTGAVAGIVVDEFEEGDDYYAPMSTIVFRLDQEGKVTAESAGYERRGYVSKVPVDDEIMKKVNGLVTAINESL